MRNSLRRVEGVSEVEVDLDEKKAWVYVVENIDSAMLIAATTNIGFPSTIGKAE